MAQDGIDYSTGSIRKDRAIISNEPQSVLGDLRPCRLGPTDEQFAVGYQLAPQLCEIMT